MNSKIEAQNIVHFAGLNGIRAIAAIAVVISHITLGLKEFNLDPYIFGTFLDGKPQGLSLAGFGVSIFFVLSGFLITYLLQVEKQILAINIKKFYLRRILRIWPLYYLYLFLSVLAILYFGFDLNTNTLLLYIFYSANVPFILNTTLTFLSHYWSLGVEEQFYVFWPWINKKISSLTTFTILFILIIITLKTYLHIFQPGTLLEEIIHITRFHCMMIGALGALLYKMKHPLFIKFTDNKFTQSICWFILFLVAINQYHLASFIDNEIISVVGLVIIIGQINIKNRIVNLEIGIMDFLGKISYGIYVIHPLIIFLFSKWLGQLNINAPTKYLIVYSLITASTIALSYLSYTYFEKYFLVFKKRFEVVKSSPTKSII
jgi:peptidoglycan/LPS O-acetylase OafA/YrhL